MSLIAISMYVIGALVGARSAMVFWRHARAMLVRRRRAASLGMPFRRRLFFLARGAAGVAAGSVVILAGAWLGGSLGDAASSRLDLLALATAITCLLLAVGAIYAGWRFDPARGATSL